MSQQLSRSFKAPRSALLGPEGRYAPPPGRQQPQWRRRPLSYGVVPERDAAGFRSSDSNAAGWDSSCHAPSRANLPPSFDAPGADVYRSAHDEYAAEQRARAALDIPASSSRGATHSLWNALLWRHNEEVLHCLERAQFARAVDIVRQAQRDFERGYEARRPRTTAGRARPQKRAPRPAEAEPLDARRYALLLQLLRSAHRSHSKMMLAMQGRPEFIEQTYLELLRAGRLLWAPELCAREALARAASEARARGVDEATAAEEAVAVAAAAPVRVAWIEERVLQALSEVESLVATVAQQGTAAELLQRMVRGCVDRTRARIRMAKHRMNAVADADAGGGSSANAHTLAGDAVASLVSMIQSDKAQRSPQFQERIVSVLHDHGGEDNDGLRSMLRVMHDRRTDRTLVRNTLRFVCAVFTAGLGRGQGCAQRTTKQARRKNAQWLDAHYRMIIHVVTGALYLHAQDVGVASAAATTVGAVLAQVSPRLLEAVILCAHRAGFAAALAAAAPTSLFPVGAGVPAVDEEAAIYAMGALHCMLVGSQVPLMHALLLPVPATLPPSTPGDDTMGLLLLLRHTSTAPDDDTRSEDLDLDRAWAKRCEAKTCAGLLDEMSKDASAAQTDLRPCLASMVSQALSRVLASGEIGLARAVLELLAAMVDAGDKLDTGLGNSGGARSGDGLVLLLNSVDAAQVVSAVRHSLAVCVAMSKASQMQRGGAVAFSSGSHALALFARKTEAPSEGVEAFQRDCVGVLSKIAGHALALLEHRVSRVAARARWTLAQFCSPAGGAFGPLSQLLSESVEAGSAVLARHATDALCQLLEAPPARERPYAFDPLSRRASRTIEREQSAARIAMRTAEQNERLATAAAEKAIEVLSSATESGGRALCAELLLASSRAEAADANTGSSAEGAEDQAANGAAQGACVVTTLVIALDRAIVPLKTLEEDRASPEAALATARRRSVLALAHIAGDGAEEAALVASHRAEEQAAQLRSTRACQTTGDTARTLLRLLSADPTDEGGDPLEVDGARGAVGAAAQHFLNAGGTRVLCEGLLSVGVALEGKTSSEEHDESGVGAAGSTKERASENTAQMAAAAAAAPAAASLLALASWLLREPPAALMLELEVTSAQGLAQADEGEGRNAKSDPYCLVYHNDRLVGKTRTVFNSHNPKWKKQHFKFPLRLLDDPVHGSASVAFDRCALRVELRDWDGEGRAAMLLGEAQLEGVALSELLAGSVETSLDADSVSDDAGVSISDDAGVWVPLQRKRWTTERQKIGNQARVRLHAVRRGVLSSAQTVCLRVMGAAGLAAADMTRDERQRLVSAASDPFALVFWNGVLVGRTPHQHDTLDPEWGGSAGGNENVFELPVSAAAANSGSTVRVEVRDFDSGAGPDGAGAFLGQVTLRGEDLDLHSTALTPGCFALQRTPWSGERQNLAQGVLQLRLHCAAPALFTRLMRLFAAHAAHAADGAQREADRARSGNAHQETADAANLRAALEVQQYGTMALASLIGNSVPRLVDAIEAGVVHALAVAFEQATLLCDATNGADKRKDSAASSAGDARRVSKQAGARVPLAYLLVRTEAARCQNAALNAMALVARVGGDATDADGPLQLALSMATSPAAARAVVVLIHALLCYRAVADGADAEHQDPLIMAAAAASEQHSEVFVDVGFLIKVGCVPVLAATLARGSSFATGKPGQSGGDVDTESQYLATDALARLAELVQSHDRPLLDVGGGNGSDHVGGDDLMASAGLVMRAFSTAFCPPSLAMVELKILSAAGVAVVGQSRHSQSDPYCLMYANDQLLGRTHPIMNSQDPEWSSTDVTVCNPEDVDEEYKGVRGEREHDGADLTRPAPCAWLVQLLPCILASSLTVEVRDYDDDEQHAGDFLGEATLQGAELMHALEGGGVPQWYPLCRKSNECSFESMAAVDIMKAEIELAVGHDEDGDALLVRVLRARGLGSADEGKTKSARSDPYASVFLNGVPLGRTPHVDDDHNPDWGAMGAAASSFALPLPLTLRDMRTRVEVRDFDESGRPVAGALLGQVELNAKRVLAVAAGADADDDPETMDDADGGYVAAADEGGDGSFEVPLQPKSRAFSREPRPSGGVSGSLRLRVRRIDVASALAIALERQLVAHMRSEANAAAAAASAAAAAMEGELRRAALSNRGGATGASANNRVVRGSTRIRAAVHVLDRAKETEIQLLLLSVALRLVGACGPMVSVPRPGGGSARVQALAPLLSRASPDPVSVAIRVLRVFAAQPSTQPKRLLPQSASHEPTPRNQIEQELLALLVLAANAPAAAPPLASAGERAAGGGFSDLHDRSLGPEGTARCLHLRIFGANDLKCADVGKGARSDPYVRALWNGIEVGRTEPKDDDHDPRWADDDNSARLRFSLPSQSAVLGGTLRVEVRDFDEDAPRVIGGALGDFLGMAEISGKALAQVLAAGESSMAASLATGADRHCTTPVAALAPAAALAGGTLVRAGGTAAAAAAPGEAGAATGPCKATSVVPQFLASASSDGATVAPPSLRAPLLKFELQRDESSSEAQHAVGGSLQLAFATTIEAGHVQVMTPFVLETALLSAARLCASRATSRAQTGRAGASLASAPAPIAEGDTDDDDYDDDYEEDEDSGDGNRVCSSNPPAPRAATVLHSVAQMAALAPRKPGDKGSGAAGFSDPGDDTSALCTDGAVRLLQRLKGLVDGPLARSGEALAVVLLVCRILRPECPLAATALLEDVEAHASHLRAQAT
eukprot:g1613.t1